MELTYCTQHYFLKECHDCGSKVRNFLFGFGANSNFIVGGKQDLERIQSFSRRMLSEFCIFYSTQIYYKAVDLLCIRGEPLLAYTYPNPIS